RIRYHAALSKVNRATFSTLCDTDQYQPPQTGAAAVQRAGVRVYNKSKSKSKERPGIPVQSVSFQQKPLPVPRPVPQAKKSQQAVLSPAKAVSKPGNNAFASPFADTALSAKEDDLLDLDSLIDEELSSVSADDEGAEEQPVTLKESDSTVVATDAGESNRELAEAAETPYTGISPDKQVETTETRSAFLRSPE
ncbi:MAG: hypothetical protein GY758_27370, partial [Fuerstiella sp.]|nr:hypothetical protein [Fuerstiella sp.]